MTCNKHTYKETNKYDCKGNEPRQWIFVFQVLFNHYI